MVLAVHKTRKKINKKGGSVGALHENSRGEDAALIAICMAAPLTASCRLYAPSPRCHER